MDYDCNEGSKLHKNKHLKVILEKSPVMPNTIGSHIMSNDLSQ